MRRRPWTARQSPTAAKATDVAVSMVASLVLGIAELFATVVDVGLVVVRLVVVGLVVVGLVVVRLGVVLDELVLGVSPLAFFFHTAVKV